MMLLKYTLSLNISPFVLCFWRMLEGYGALLVNCMRPDLGSVIFYRCGYLFGLMWDAPYRLKTVLWKDQGQMVSWVWISMINLDLECIATYGPDV